MTNLDALNLDALMDDYRRLIAILDRISPPRPAAPADRSRRSIAEVSFGASVSGPVGRRPWSPAKRRRHGAAMRAAWARRRAK